MKDELLHRLNEYLVRSYDRLEYGGATGCRCMSCHSFKLIDLDDKITYEEESLFELIERLPK